MQCRLVAGVEKIVDNDCVVPSRKGRLQMTDNISPKLRLERKSTKEIPNA
jgi:hypothetical protein